MGIHRLTRRSMLTGFGATAAALPFIPLPSDAAPREYPKRLIIMHTPNGTVMEDFWPSSGMTLGSILAPLEPYKSRLLLMRGVDMDSAYLSPKPKDHWPDTMNALTARQGIIQGDQTSMVGGISIDQHILNHLPNETKFGSIHLGAQTMNQQILCATGPGNGGIPPIDDPSSAFAQLFADLDLDPFELAAQRAQRKSVLDTVSAELSGLQAQFSGAHRDKVQQHLDSIAAMEAALEFGAAGPNCTAPTLQDTNPSAAAQYPLVIAQQFEVIRHALQCDLARVATIQFGARKIHPTWIGIDHSHHGISHGSEGVTANVNQRTEWLIDIENWHAQQFKLLLDRLDSVDEGEGTLLDHSLVIWAHEQSNGANHLRRDMPYVMAGGLHGEIEMGRKLDAGGVPHNRLLVSIAEAMGVPTEQFGDPQFDSSPLTDFYSP